MVKGSYPPDTTFYDRSQENIAHKQAVAVRVVEQVLGEGQSAFVSDGSSTFYVGVSLFAEAPQSFQLFTNSIPIAHEFGFWRTNTWPRDFHLDLAGGSVNPELLMTGGAASYGQIEDVVKRAEWTILSVLLLFGDRGPAGKEFDSLQIKQTAVRQAKRIVFIADYSKFQVPYACTAPLVFATQNEWQSVMKGSNSYVVTSLPPGRTATEMHDLGRKLVMARKNPETEEEWYARNTWDLRMEMKDRFVEIQV